jgi:hypothetical protein
VYALGKVTGVPYWGRTGDGWSDPSENDREEWTVPMELTLDLRDSPILLSELDERFDGVTVVRNTANPHPLDDRQWSAITEHVRGG